VVKYIEKHPDCKIHLIGHSDRAGGFDYNFDLSVKRVEAVQNMLIAKGIKADRIQATFKGELMPRYEEIAKNRRVEIFIMGQ